MGQKTNPLCFRLGTTQNHYSVWFEEPKRYPTGIQEDKKIRDFFTNYITYRVQKFTQFVHKEYSKKKKKKKKIKRIKKLPPLGFEKMVRIEIEKQGPNKTKKTLIGVKIYSAFVPRFLCRGNTRKNFEGTVKKQEFYTIYSRQIVIQLKKARRPYSEPNLIAEFIALQLKNRVPFRKTMKYAIDLARRTNIIKGIKLQLAGRIDGKDIARNEGKRKGKLPLHKICAKIDYCSHTIQTIYGVLGLKIWIFIKN